MLRIMNRYKAGQTEAWGNLRIAFYINMRNRFQDSYVIYFGYW